MTFTMPSFPIMQPDQSNPFYSYDQAMQGQLARLQRNQLQAQLPYAAPLAQADVMNKMLTPLATIASNPNLLATMTPEQLQNLSGLVSHIISNPLGSVNTANGNYAIGGGLINNLMRGTQQNNSPSIYGGQDQSQVQQNNGGNVNQSSINLSNNNVPYASNLPQAGKGPYAGAIAKTQGQFNAQVQPPGTFYYDNNTQQYRTTSTPQMLTDDQIGMGAVQQAIPLINKLQAESADLLQPGKNLAWTKSLLAAGGKAFGLNEDQLKTLGISPDFYNKWVQFEADQNNVAERIMTAYKYPNTEGGIATAKSLVAPGLFEQNDAYKKRMDKEISNLLSQNDIYVKHMASGFNSSPGASPELPSQYGNQNVSQGMTGSSQSQQGNASQSNSPSQGAKILSKQMKLPSFANKQVFQEWYKRQPKLTQDAVKIQLGAA